MSEIVEVPFQSLEPWIWYPSFKDVFWLQEDMIKAMKQYDADNFEDNYFSSEYVRKNYGKDIAIHISKIRYEYVLWKSINNEGFDKDRSVFQMSVKSDGSLEVIDGFHRLNFLHHLKYNGNIRIEILEEAPAWLEFKQVLLDINSYTPTNHPLLRDMVRYRTDSAERLKVIRSEIPEKVGSIVDLGTCEGYFALGLADLASNMIIGVESNKKRINVARYLRNLIALDNVSFCESDLVEFFKDADSSEPDHFDVGVFLSTFHHLVIHHGEHTAWMMLKNLSEKIDTLFFSMAVCGDKVWVNHPSIAIEQDDVPLLVEKFWGYNRFKVLEIKTNNERVMFKFWRE